jgi:predicted nuclease of predicted toxin-antitoxin system
MVLRLLLDEQVEPSVQRYLEREGHDVVHTREVDDLGAGSADHEVAAYSKRTGRSILTNDDDFFSQIDADLPTVFHFPNQRPSAYQITSILGAVEEQFTEAELAQEDVVALVEGWL